MSQFFTPTAYLIHFPNIHNRKAKKSHICEVCSCEIPKGDYYYTYKPYPINNVWFGWRKRCIDHKPLKYDEVFMYFNQDEKTIQSKKIVKKPIIVYNKRVEVPIDIAHIKC